MVRSYKPCLRCYDLFQQKKTESVESFMARIHCDKCKEQQPKISHKPALSFRAIKMAEKPDRAKREVVEVTNKRKTSKHSRGSSKKKPVDRSNRIFSIDVACARYAEKENMPLELARKLWGLS